MRGFHARKEYNQICIFKKIILVPVVNAYIWIREMRKRDNFVIYLMQYI